MNAKMKFNDKYEYPVRYTYGEDLFPLSIKPLDSQAFYIYQSVPNEIKDKFEKCVIEFGFNDNFKFIPPSISETGVLSYNYQITINK